MRAVRLLSACLVVLALAAAASAAPGDPHKQIVPAVQAKARAINVRLADLPAASWRVRPSSASASSPPRCSYYHPDQSDLTENGSADSPEFTLPSTSFVSSSTSIFQTPAQGRTAYARVVRPLLPRCLGEIFRKGTGQPERVRVVSAAAMSFPNLAERTHAYRVAADFRTSPKTTVHVYLDLVALNRGKVDVVVFFAGIGLPFGASFERTVVGRVAARMAAA